MECPFSSRKKSRRPALTLLTLIDFAVGAVKIAVQTTPLFVGHPAVAARTALRRRLRTAKIRLRLTLGTVLARLLQLRLDQTAAEIAPGLGERRLCDPSQHHHGYRKYDFHAHALFAIERVSAAPGGIPPVIINARQDGIDTENMHASTAYHCAHDQHYYQHAHCGLLEVRTLNSFTATRDEHARLLSQRHICRDI
jgi:hypothetical protein